MCDESGYFDHVYRLIYRDVIKCKSMDDFRKAFEDRWQLVDEIGDKTVSTVFLALDHNFILGGQPLVFETMVFPDQDLCNRYHTLEDAIKGHYKIVKQIKEETDAK